MNVVLLNVVGVGLVGVSVAVQALVGASPSACPSLRSFSAAGPPVVPIMSSYREVVRKNCALLTCRQAAISRDVWSSELDYILYDSRRPQLAERDILRVVEGHRSTFARRLARADDLASFGNYREASALLLADVRDPAMAWRDPLISDADFAAMLSYLAFMATHDVSENDLFALRDIAQRNVYSKAPRFAFALAALARGCRSQALLAVESIPYQQTMPPYRYSYVDAEAIRFAVRLDPAAFRLAPRRRG